MAKNSIRDFSATAGSNTDIQSVNIDENCPASGINNAIRELMVDLKNVSTGAVNLETPGADQINVDNIRIDGNTISSTATNGDITLDPAGTGVVAITGVITANGHTSSAPSVFEASGNGDQVGVQLKVKANNGSTSTQGLYGNAGSTNAGNTIVLGNSGSSGLLVDSSGNVGIGTTAPSAAMHIISGSDNANTLLLADTTTDNTIVDGFVTSRHANSAEEPVLMIQGRSTGSANEVLIGGTHNNTTYNTATSVKFYTASSDTSTTPSERMRISSTGELLINGTSNVGIGRISINFDRATHAGIELKDATTSSARQLRFKNANGTVGEIVSTGSSTTYFTSSDHRLKENVVDMTGAIARVKQLAPKRFNFIADDTVTVDGFIAHEAQTVVPEAVGGEHNEVDDDGNAVMQGIDQSKLVPLLTGALREAIAKIETLETEMTALKARVTALEA